MKKLLFCMPLVLLGACVDKGTTDDTGDTIGTDDTGDTDTDTTPSDLDGDGYTTEDGDCDDSNDAVRPDADEVCDGIDNDCDALIDDADDSVTGQGTWYADTDGDGFGDEAVPTLACTQPSGTVADAIDCDDSSDAIRPDADEVCDSIDNDCDTLVDDADDSVTDQGTWYADTDGDGFGDDAAPTLACTQPSGTISAGGDCDDGDETINPDAEESCLDGVDTNCDGSGDETCTACADLSVIAYYDSFSTPPLDLAVAGLGMTLSSNNSESLFTTDYAKSTWDVVIVDVPGSGVPAGVQSAISAQLASGDGVIFSYWDLDGSTTLQTTLGVRVVRSFDTPLPLYSSEPLWSLYETLPLPISSYSDDAGDNGDVIAALDAKTSEVLASFDAKGTEASIVSTFSGQVIVNGFLPWDYQDTDDNSNGTSDMVELYTNELLWMLNCTP